MKQHDAYIDLFRLSLRSFSCALADLSLECERIKNEGIKSPQQVNALVAQHEQLMSNVYETLIRFTSTDPALAAAVSDQLKSIELQIVLGQFGIHLPDGIN